MKQTLRMNQIRPGQRAIVESVSADSEMERRFLDIGLIPGTMVACIGRSPGGDPSAYLIRGAVIAIRAVNCAGIALSLCEEETQAWD